MSSPALTELLRGKGSHADPIVCVEDLSADLAARQVPGFPHSIAQLVFHMNYWMDYELRRIRGQRPAYPDHNSESFPAPSPTDAEEWGRLTNQFATLLADFAALANSPPAEMQRQIETTHVGIPRSQEHSKPFSGRWSRTTAITWARSQ
jgi:hypothetical protein